MCQSQIKVMKYPENMKCSYSVGRVPSCSQPFVLPGVTLDSRVSAGDERLGVVMQIVSAPSLHHWLHVLNWEKIHPVVCDSQDFSCWGNLLYRVMDCGISSVFHPKLAR